MPLYLPIVSARSCASLLFKRAVLCHDRFLQKVYQLAYNDDTIGKDQLMVGDKRDQPHVRAAGNAPAHVVNWGNLVVRSVQDQDWLWYRAQPFLGP